jgi:hypothetical protein
MNALLVSLCRLIFLFTIFSRVCFSIYSIILASSFGIISQRFAGDESPIIAASEQVELYCLMFLQCKAWEAPETQTHMLLQVSRSQDQMAARQTRTPLDRPQSFIRCANDPGRALIHRRGVASPPAGAVLDSTAVLLQAASHSISAVVGQQKKNAKRAAARLRTRASYGTHNFI